MTKKVIGLDIVSLGKNVFGGVHTAGGALARAFGAGAAVDALTKIETNAGLLPSWAQGTSPSKPAAVTSPDFVVIVHAAPQQPDVITGPASAVVTGGKRFDGNGYKSGQGFGSSFSFGYDGPTKIDVVSGGTTTSYASPKQVLFLGGAEATPAAPATAVKGDEMSEILGAMSTDEAVKALGEAVDDLIGWSNYDTAAAIFSGGQTAPISAILNAFKSHQTGHNYSGGAAYAPQAASADVAARLVASQATLAATKSSLQSMALSRLAASQAMAASLMPTPIAVTPTAPMSQFAPTPMPTYVPPIPTPTTDDSTADSSDVLGTDWSQLAYNPLGLVYAPASLTSSHQSGRNYTSGTAYAPQAASAAAAAGLTAASSQLAAAKSALSQMRAQRLQAALAVAASNAASGTSVSVASPNTVSPGDLQAALTATTPAPTSDSTTTDASASTTSSSDGSTPTVVGLERSKTMEFDILGNKILGDLASAGDTDAAQAAPAPHHRHHHHHHHQPPVDQVTGQHVHPAMKGTYLHGCEILGAMPLINNKGPLPPVHPTLTGTLGARLATTNATINTVKNSTVPPLGIVLQKAPLTGRTFTSLKINPMKKRDPATSVSNAQTVSKRAISVGQKLAAAATKLGKTAVKGDDDWTEIVGETDALNWTEILGAVKPVGKPMGAKLTATKLKQMADQLTKAGKDLGTQATKFDTAYKASAKKIAAGVKVVAAKLDPRKSVSIKGIDELEATHSILGDFLGHALNNYEVLGQYYDPATGQYDSPYPTSSTGTTDPTIDPATGIPYSQEGYSDPTTGGNAESTVPGPTTDPAPYGLGPAPTTAPVQSATNGDFVADPGYATDTNIYDSTRSTPGSIPQPVGAVPYSDDGTHDISTTAKSTGSFGYFHQGIPGIKSRDGNGSGYIWRGNGWVAYIKSATANNDQKLKSDEAQSLPIMAANSVKNQWGPLIGNPAGGWTAGLRYDVGKDQWFWYQDQARKVAPWSVAAQDAVALNLAITDYKTNLTAATVDYQNAVYQDQIDAQNAQALATQQAQEDAVAQHQQEMAMNQANSDAQNQMTALQPQQAQLQQQYMQQQMQQQQQESQYEAQMAQQQMQMQQMQLQYLQQNPQAMAQMFAPPPPDDSQYAQQQGGYGDQGGSGYSGGDGGYGDDDSVDAGIDWDDGSNNGRDSIDDME